jgi:hypothetical protein
LLQERVNPLQKIRYRGPGALEWIFSFLATILIGSQLMVFRRAGEPQTSYGYYFQESGVETIHWAAVVVNGLFIATTLYAIVRGRKQGAVTVLWVTAALVGIALAWYELARIVNAPANPLYVFDALPFRPVNNFGLLGAQIYGSYLLLKLPDGDLPKWLSFIVKIGFAACFFALQAVAWDWMAGG